MKTYTKEKEYRVCTSSFQCWCRSQRCRTPVNFISSWNFTVGSALVYKSAGFLHDWIFLIFIFLPFIWSCVKQFLINMLYSVSFDETFPYQWDTSNVIFMNYGWTFFMCLNITFLYMMDQWTQPNAFSTSFIKCN